MTPYQLEVIEIDIGGRTFWEYAVGSWVLESKNAALTQLIHELQNRVTVLERE